MPDHAEDGGTDGRRRLETGGPAVKTLMFAFLAAGLGLLLTAGRAQDFWLAGLSGLFHLVLLAGLPLALYLAAASVWRQMPGARGAPLLLTVIALAWLLAVAGARITAARFDATVARGDALIELIEAYRDENGDYPASLRALAAAGAALPEPALQGTTFNYAPMEDGGYRLSFLAEAFLICSRQPDYDRWVCDD